MRKSLNRVLASAATVSLIASMFVTSSVSAASPTLMKDTLDRQKISVSAIHSLSMTLPAPGITNGATLTVTYTGFGTDFAGTPTVTCGAGSATAGFATNVLTLTGGGTACTGTLTVTPFTGTNPGTSGSKTITIAGSSGPAGTFAIAISDDDQVTVTATVDPSITFVAAAQAAEAYDCSDAASLTAGGTVALGTLTTGSITSSDVNAVKHICTRVSTNATSGAIVTVKSTNGRLQSTSVGTDFIPSASAAMAAGTANYGLCAGDRFGSATTTPASAQPVQDSLFDQTCTNDAAAGTVGALTTSAQTVWHVIGPTSLAFQNLVVKAAISGTTVAHSDYTDTLTFVATGTF